jgi:hypothetical protein
VAREMNNANEESIFVATPPLEAKRALFSITASRRRRTGRPLKLSFKPTFLELPEEESEDGMIGELDRCMCGTCAAAQGWEAEYARTMIEIGFVRGRAPPCCFYHRQWDVRCVVLGDDFTSIGEDPDLDRFEHAMKEHYELKVRGRLGPEKGDDKEIRILNRVVRCTADGIEYEADRRHSELLVRDLDIINVAALTAPGVKKPASELGDEELQKKLSLAESVRFRALAARTNNLAADRRDIQFAAKEICRRVSSLQDWAAQLHLGRYLKGRPRAVAQYPWQQSSEIHVRCDSDWAGCARTRKSTSGGILMMGGHVVKTWSTTQTTIALSSGEAKYYGVIRAAAAGLGMQGLLEDLGIQHQLVVHTDSSSALGIAKRSGLGKTRHIAVHLLWIQDQLREGRFDLRKVLGTENPTDLLTKHLTSLKINEHLGRMGFRFDEGRSSAIPTIV